MDYFESESESIEIIRVAMVTARNPVTMYSIGKDSSVMLHLACKAFYPAPPPFPLLHIDTGWKFKDMYVHRTRMVVERGGQLIMVDYDRFPFAPGELAQMRQVRFRTLACWPLTSAIDSDTETLEAVIAETFNARSSECQGRLIDSDVRGSMEKKKLVWMS